MYAQALNLYVKASNLAKDTKAELDEKALLIGVFVVVAIVGLGTLGPAVSDAFTDVAGSI